ncbi:hypothetical protein [Shewanella frigidimarina]|uniref:hypothetical protein n=1 Tax=Shewanella frigidimarina TaxID=56812 RepID=UPI003D7A8A20
MNQTLFKLVIVTLASLCIASYSLEMSVKTAAKTTGQQTGTWENKDEDGDGVPDVQDDYPFDASQSKYKLVHEQEFNNNQDVATIVSEVPARLSGVIQQINDLDFYKLQLESGQQLTFLLSSISDKLNPGMAVLGSDGIAINSWAPNYHPVGQFKRAIQIKPRQSGVYYLVINDKQFQGNADYTYTIDVFFDHDVDAINDSHESAFGFALYSQDSDSDGAFDGDEFHVNNHDMDNDGIPNWLDEDADGDGIKDQYEGSSDLDQDGLAALVDLDSDGNGVSDAVDVGGSSTAPIDSDADSVADFIDLDDDNDLILDVHDQEPLVKVKSAPYGTDSYKDIASIYYLFDGQTPIKNIMISNKMHRLTGEGLTDGLLVFNRNTRVPINMPVSANADGSIDFVLPVNASNIRFVALNTITSNEVIIEYRNQYIPILLGQEKLHTSPNAHLVITGQKFNEQTTVFVSGIEIIPIKITPTELSITIPNTIKSGELYVKNTYGKSNTLTLIINNAAF